MLRVAFIAAGMTQHHLENMVPSAPKAILPLPQAVLLHSAKERGGFATSYAEMAVAGAALAELLIRGTFDVRKEGKKALIVGGSAGVPDDPCLRLAHGRMTRKDLGRPAGRILERASGRPLLTCVRDDLVARGELATEQKQFLGITWLSYRPGPAGGRQELIEDLRRLLEDRAEPDDRQVALLALIGALSMQHHVFGRETARRYKDQLKALASESASSVAVKEAIDAMQAALVVVLAAGAAAGSG